MLKSGMGLESWGQCREAGRVQQHFRKEFPVDVGWDLCGSSCSLLPLEPGCDIPCCAGVTRVTQWLCQGHPAGSVRADTAGLCWPGWSVILPCPTSVSPTLLLL